MDHRLAELKKERDNLVEAYWQPKETEKPSILASIIDIDERMARLNHYPELTSAKKDRRY